MVQSAQVQESCKPIGAGGSSQNLEDSGEAARGAAGNGGVVVLKGRSRMEQGTSVEILVRCGGGEGKMEQLRLGANCRGVCSGCGGSCFIERSGGAGLSTTAKVEEV